MVQRVRFSPVEWTKNLYTVHFSPKDNMSMRDSIENKHLKGLISLYRRQTTKHFLSHRVPLSTPVPLGTRMSFRMLSRTNCAKSSGHEMRTAKFEKH